MNPRAMNPATPMPSGPPPRPAKRWIQKGVYLALLRRKQTLEAIGMSLQWICFWGFGFLTPTTRRLLLENPEEGRIFLAALVALALMIGPGFHFTFWWSDRTASRRILTSVLDSDYPGEWVPTDTGADHEVCSLWNALTPTLKGIAFGLVFNLATRVLGPGVNP